MATTLVGIFDDYARAQAAVQELTQAGVRLEDIQIARNEAEAGDTTYGGADAADRTTGTSIGDRISNFFSNLFGSNEDEQERGIYSEAVRRGSTVVAVNVDDQMIDHTAEIMNRYGAVDIDERAEQYQATGTTGLDAAIPAYAADQTRQERDTLTNQGEVAIPVVEEQLQVGKRAVRRGGVRIYTRVTERPVEETVNLREEQVCVDRRSVDRPVSEADVDAVRDGAM